MSNMLKHYTIMYKDGEYNYSVDISIRKTDAVKLTLFISKELCKYS